MKKCNVQGCGQNYYAKGYCNRHWQCLKRTGVPQTEASKNWVNKRGQGYIDGYGYKKFSIKGKAVREHRMVMEKHLGRKLLITEHIHHINGNKLDNRIENLKLVDNWTHKLEHTKEYKDGVKSCSRCGVIKDLKEFAFRLNNIKSRDRRRFYDSWCHTCKREVDNNYKLKTRHPERFEKLQQNICQPLKDLQPKKTF